MGTMAPNSSHQKREYEDLHLTYANELLSLLSFGLIKVSPYILFSLSVKGEQ